MVSRTHTIPHIFRDSKMGVGLGNSRGPMSLGVPGPNPTDSKGCYGSD